MTLIFMKSSPSPIELIEARRWQNLTLRFASQSRRVGSALSDSIARTECSVNQYHAIWSCTHARTPDVLRLGSYWKHLCETCLLPAVLCTRNILFPSTLLFCLKDGGRRFLRNTALNCIPQHQRGAAKFDILCRENVKSHIFWLCYIRSVYGRDHKDYTIYLDMTASPDYTALTIEVRKHHPFSVGGLESET
jgi:hypothetical protein